MLRYLSKFFYILPAEKQKLLVLVLIVFLVSGVEVIGIGLIGPFINLASHSELIHKNYWLNLVYVQLGFSQSGQFIAFVGLFIILIFCTKSLLSWLVQRYIFKFTYSQKEKLIDRLMGAYLNASYTTYINKNSAQIINNVTNQTTIFANGILGTLLASTVHGINIITISLFLCVIDPLAVVILLLIISPLLVLFSLFKNKMHFWGQELYEAKQEMIRTVNHGLGGFKESRVIGCGSYFRQQCNQQAQRYANASIGFFAFKLVPRYIVETVLVLFLIGFTSISLLLERDMQQLTPTLSIFALASIRLMPAFSNIAAGLSKLKNSSYSLDQLYLELKELEKEVVNATSKTVNHSSLKTWSSNTNQDSQTITFTKELVLNQLTYRYPNSLENALNQISLAIPKGKSIALIGKSGTGKTTLVDVILGLLIPQEGDIKVDGRSIYENLRSWQNLIGYIPQSIFLIDDTIARNIAFGIPDHEIDQQRLYQAIQAAQLSEVVENLPDGINTRVGERGIMLSGGQRQRVGIARALYHEREILVLDEATSALDNETEKYVTEAIKSLSGTKTMIIIAHRLTTVEHCDRVYLMDQGQIIKSGSYQEVVLKKGLLSNFYASP
ncbi:ABC transporter related protein [Halothece sp. PCC 7418]|uniref:ABC transporter ATP-binding protein n=1 Tax=Halothece sp. (strain PCC 7418) TaxID=65093 RepID=UPI0002A073EF|nr:ABC transporter ATP-binding protein [Halothece sp. PCC 7418]AFZ44051.1 ABC transporter related protein [Halothece sp. PCC 7418]